MESFINWPYEENSIFTVYNLRQADKFCFKKGVLQSAVHAWNIRLFTFTADRLRQRKKQSAENNHTTVQNIALLQNSIEIKIIWDRRYKVHKKISNANCLLSMTMITN